MIVKKSKTNSRSWHCAEPGCRGCGAGYGSEHQAAAAARRHMQSSHLHHRPAQTGVAL